MDMTLLEQWLDDQSFVNWAKQLDENDVAKWEAYLNGHPKRWEMAKPPQLPPTLHPIPSSKSTIHPRGFRWYTDFNILERAKNILYK